MIRETVRERSLLMWRSSERLFLTVADLQSFLCPCTNYSSHLSVLRKSTPNRIADSTTAWVLFRVSYWPVLWTFCEMIIMAEGNGAVCLGCFVLFSHQLQAHRTDSMVLYLVSLLTVRWNSHRISSECNWVALREGRIFREFACFLRTWKLCFSFPY